MDKDIRPSARNEHASIAGIDLVRFSAALSVLWFHWAFWTWSIPRATAHDVVAGTFSFPELASMAWAGWVGVQTFFVISGFVIAMSAEHKSALAFFKGRFLRLYPTVWLAAPLTVIVLLALTSRPELRVARALVKSLALYPMDDWVSGVYWTLGIEMCFYALVWALIYCNAFRRFERFLVILAIPSTICWFSTLFAGDPLHFVRDQRFAELLLLDNGAEFALGGLLWVCMRQGVTTTRLLLMSLFALVGILEIHFIGVQYGAMVPGGVSPNTPVWIWLASLAAIIASIRWNDSTSRMGSRTLAAIRFVGLATFPLYLIHDEIGNGLIRLATGAHFSHTAALVCAGIAVGALAVAILLAERPFRRLVGRHLDAFVSSVSRFARTTRRMDLRRTGEE